jgi:16S rRNA (cytosine967-C5)-methyltransferase
VGLYDAVLLDAPCSATGTFRRHPDVLHRIGDSDIALLAALQRDLLIQASRWVSPGGRLVFATCSLEREEGEAVIDAFLTDHPAWTLEPVLADEVPAGVAIAHEGWVRTLPSVQDGAASLDGFFVARLLAPQR